MERERRLVVAGDEADICPVRLGVGEVAEVTHMQPDQDGGVLDARARGSARAGGVQGQGLAKRPVIVPPGVGRVR